MGCEKRSTGVLLLILLMVLLISVLQSGHQHQATVSIKGSSKHQHPKAPSKTVQLMDWHQILHFIPEKSRNLRFLPEKNNHSCLSLFTTESSRHIKITQDMQNMREMISKELNGAERLTPEHPKLTLTYQELARQEFVHTVCEIGFNVGQSAISWLTTKTNIELYSFDIGTRPFTKHMGKVLEKKYPGRFKLMIGDSKHTVLKWVAKHGKKCDILSIDGDHRFEGFFQDLLNMRVLAAKRNIIIADDITLGGVRKGWQMLLDEGYIHHLYDCRIHGIDLDFAIGYYPNV